MPDFERIRIGGGAELAPCVIGICCDDRAAAIGNGDDIALQILHIPIRPVSCVACIIYAHGRTGFVITEGQTFPIANLRDQLPVGKTIKGRFLD